MRGFGVVFVLLAGLFSAVAMAEEPFSCNSDELLAGSARHDWQRQRQVMRLLSNRRGERVADIGAGKGFFTEQFAARVGGEGRVYAVETDPELVTLLEEFVTRFPDSNAEVVRAKGTDLGLPVGDLDMVFSANTWHHVADRDAMREAVQRTLKPGGRFVVVDWRTEDAPMAPPVDHRLPRKKLIAEMRADGWTLTTDARFLKYQYCLIFTPPKN